MSGMIDRVSVALANSQTACRNLGFDELDAIARIAIEAMREPTLTMLYEGEGMCDYVMPEGFKNTREARQAELRCGWQTMIDVNLTGVFRMTRAVVSQMLKQGKGTIVNISSVASLVGIPGAPAYAASKGGVDAFTRALAIDYARDGIRCNVVNPGLIDTPMAAPLMSNPDLLAPILSHYAMRRPGTPEEVANMVLFLASDEAGWVTGGTFTIDGGMTISKG